MNLLFWSPIPSDFTCIRTHTYIYICTRVGSLHVCNDFAHIIYVDPYTNENYIPTNEKYIPQERRMQCTYFTHNIYLDPHTKENCIPTKENYIPQKRLI